MGGRLGRTTAIHRSHANAPYSWRIPASRQGFIDLLGFIHKGRSFHLFQRVFGVVGGCLPVLWVFGGVGGPLTVPTWFGCRAGAGGRVCHCVCVCVCHCVCECVCVTVCVNVCPDISFSEVLGLLAAVKGCLGVLAGPTCFSMFRRVCVCVRVHACMRDPLLPPFCMTFCLSSELSV